MAVSVSLLTPEPYAIGGAYVEVLAEVTFDSSYPTGGEAVTANDFKLGTILHMTCEAAPATGITFAFDRANLKIKGFRIPALDGEAASEQNPAEVTAATNLSTSVVPVRVVGRP